MLKDPFNIKDSFKKLAEDALAGAAAGSLSASIASYLTDSNACRETFTSSRAEAFKIDKDGVITRDDRTMISSLKDKNRLSTDDGTQSRQITNPGFTKPIDKDGVITRDDRTMISSLKDKNRLSTDDGTQSRQITNPDFTKPLEAK